MATGWRGRVRRAGGAVLRRARPGSGRSGTARSPGATAEQRSSARVDQALVVVQAVEAAVPALPGTATPELFLGLDRVVRRPELHPRLLHLVPAPLRGSWEGRADVRSLHTPLAADAVVLAKFDLGSRVKLRAGYGDAGLALAVQPVRADGTSGVTSAERAYAVVNRHCPGLAPALHATGTLQGGYAYLVEDWVDGEPLVSDRRLADELVPLLKALARVHDGYGIALRRPSELWGPALEEQWRAVREQGLVTDAVGDAVARLVAADRLLRVSWTHGDLAASNIFTTSSGLTVIDWEHGAERPVMYDGARLHLFAADPPSTVERLLGGWGSGTADGCYPPEQELALMHARFVSQAPVRLARLEGHPRRATYERQLDRQTGLLEAVLELPESGPRSG